MNRLRSSAFWFGSSLWGVLASIHNAIAGAEMWSAISAAVGCGCLYVAIRKLSGD